MSFPIDLVNILCKFHCFETNELSEPNCIVQYYTDMYKNGNKVIDYLFSTSSFYKPNDTMTQSLFDLLTEQKQNNYFDKKWLFFKNILRGAFLRTQSYV